MYFRWFHNVHQLRTKELFTAVVFELWLLETEDFGESDEYDSIFLGGVFLMASS